jgi:hypothetical protein
VYEHADYEKLRQNLFNVNWDSLFLTDDIELITNDITNAILSAAESSIPSKIVTIFYTRNLFNYVPPVFARRIHACIFFD